MKRLILLTLMSVAVTCLSAQVKEGLYMVDKFSVAYGEDFTVSEDLPVGVHSMLTFMGGSLSVSFHNYPAVTLVLSEETETGSNSRSFTTVDAFTGYRSKMSASYNDDGQLTVTLDRGEGRFDTFTAHWIGTGQ